MTRLLALAVVAAIFVIGIAVGALGMHLHGSTGSLAEAIHGKAGRHGEIAIDDPRHIDRLARELDLDADQKEQITTILREARTEARKLHEQLSPAVQDHIRRTRVRVSAVLTPDQNRVLDELTEKHRPNIERMMLTPD